MKFLHNYEISIPKFPIYMGVIQQQFWILHIITLDPVKWWWCYSSIIYHLINHM